LIDEALLEVDDTIRAAEIASGQPHRSGWKVRIELPVYGKSQLLRGHVDYGSGWIHVGWRFKQCEDRPLMPALRHEVCHVLTGAGHGSQALSLCESNP